MLVATEVYVKKRYVIMLEVAENCGTFPYHLVSLRIIGPRTTLEDFPKLRTITTVYLSVVRQRAALNLGYIWRNGSNSGEKDL
jgi:hypothetical protein